MMNTDELTKKILLLLEKFQRRYKKECDHKNTTDCLLVHSNKIMNFIQNNLPIHFILPAFPAKSPNTKKTEGPHPDLGERLSLIFLNALCNQIKEIYSAGASICICSDGRVFSDLVNVSDEKVNVYSAGIKKIISDEALVFLHTFDLDDYYQLLSNDERRKRLSIEYAENIESLKNRLHTEEFSKRLFNGMHRFVFEDYCALFNEYSKNKLKKVSKKITYQLIQRSNAWSRLLSERFPHSVRLSIHPQHCGSEKLGIMLLSSDQVWATPWHRVVLKSQDVIRLVSKQDAIALGATRILQNNMFSHYEA